VVRTPEHHASLQDEVLAQFTTASPCRSKINRPPSAKARIEARKLVANHEDNDVVVDLAAYQRLVEAMGKSGQSA
jgi:hypothetical protein